MQKRILKQAKPKKFKTYTGQIPKSVGYQGFQGGYTMPSETQTKLQKKNGFSPLNAIWDKKAKKYKIVYLSLILAISVSSCFQGTKQYYFVYPVRSDMVCLP